MSMLPFVKMHGLGNDFVIFDARREPLHLGAAQVSAMADRRTGVGCDQLIVMEPPAAGLADVFMRIYNADGGEAEACGNATRCVASLLMAEKDTRQVVVETVAGLLDAEAGNDGLITVDMGRANLDWRDIPLAEPVDTLHLGIDAGPFSDPVAVNMGNPHAVFFVDDAETAPLETFGPVIERHPLYPERTNVEAAQVLSPGTIRLRVWERGVGITRASGSCACATLVAANRRGLCGRTGELLMDGGRLAIEWLDDGHVLMSGPVATSFRGTLEL